MLEKKVIQPSSSAWASPIVPVPKKDGTQCFRVDYRRMNAVTKKDVYPLLRIDDILDTLSGTNTRLVFRLLANSAGSRN